jgi:hypothetical protein
MIHERIVFPCDISIGLQFCLWLEGYLCLVKASGGGKRGGEESLEKSKNKYRKAKSQKQSEGEVIVPDFIVVPRGRPVDFFRE